MAFDSTLGGSAATSYIDVATADAFYADSLKAADWGALTQQEKEIALIASTANLEVLSFAGTRCSPSTDDPAKEQRLQWPRSGATCKGVAATCAAIPNEVQSACAMLALDLHKNPDAIWGGAPSSGGTTGAIQSQQLGDLSISYYDVQSGTMTTGKVDDTAPLVLQRFPYLIDILGCWSKTATSSGGRVLLRVRS